jgi:nucleoside-diphosphate-sugar epimerase
MKLIIAGGSGFVATELIRQSLALPQITTVIVLARRPVSAPTDSAAGDPSKLHSIVLQDYDEYPDEVKKQLADADACIW